jgi:Domain of Unknown Function (DUF1521)
MQSIERVTSAPVDPGLMGSVSEKSFARPAGGRPAQVCDVHGLGAATGGIPDKGGSPERFVEAVVGVVTAVIDLIVVALARAKAGREAAPQRPEFAQPIGVIKPKPPSGGALARPPLTTDSGMTVNKPHKALEVIQDDSGIATVRTSDGYTVRAGGQGAGWSVTSPEGKTTHISGDLEAHESDGGRWRHQGRSSFVFGENKVTVETRSPRGAASVASQMTVYHGQERVTLAGLDTQRTTILALASDGKQHDDGLNDGTTFFRDSTVKGESWAIIENGKRKVMGAK